MVTSDVQIVILDFVQTEDGLVQKLCGACRRNLFEQVDELLWLPLNPNVKDEEDIAPLNHAAVSGHVQCVALLLEAGAKTDVPTFENFGGMTGLVEHGHMEVVRLLLEAGAAIEVLLLGGASNSDGRRVLHCAAAQGHLEVLRLVLEAGVDKDMADYSGRTALHLAAQNGRQEVVRLLLAVGADRDVADVSGRTALQLAALNNNQPVMKPFRAAPASSQHA